MDDPHSTSAEPDELPIVAPVPEQEGGATGTLQSEPQTKAADEGKRSSYLHEGT